MVKKLLSVSFLIALTINLTGCGMALQSAPDKQAKQKASQGKTQNSKESKSFSNGTPMSKKINIQEQVMKKPKTFQQDGKTVTVVANPTDLLVLVNKTHQLPLDFKPINLVIPNVTFTYSNTQDYEKSYMQASAAKALAQLFQAAKQDGIILEAVSGFRSYQRQKAIFAYNVKTEGETAAARVSAHPGQSEHETGLAMDITSQDFGANLVPSFGDTTAGKWVAAHADQYGFIIRYPKGKEQITGYEYEPWHIRYVGKNAATYIYGHHLTLEEYIKQKQG